MQKIIIIVFAIFFTSCQNYGYHPIMDFSFQFNRCQIFCYDVDKLEIVNDRKCGDDFESGIYEISKCDGIIGFHYKFISEELIPKIKKDRRDCR